VEFGFGLAKAFDGRDGAIFDVDDAVSKIGDATVVGDDGDGAVVFVRELAHEFQHGAAGAGIERGSGLIGEEDFRVSGQRAGQRDTLLLSSAEIGGKGGGFVVKLHLFEQVERLAASDRAANSFQLQCDFDIFNRGKRGKEIEGLKDEPNVIEADAGQFALAETGDLFACDLNAAGSGTQDAAHDRQKRGLAAARWSHEKKQLASVEIEVNPLKSRDTRGAFSIYLANSADSNGNFHLFPRWM